MARTDDDSWDITESVGATAPMARHEREMAGDVPDTGSVFVEGRRLTD
jgi:hypothetical protein